jgi:hypothetical protein
MTKTVDVAPNEKIASTWGNEIRDRTAQVFASNAERDSQWPAVPDGAVCVTVDTGILWLRRAGVWVAISPGALPTAYSVATTAITLAGTIQFISPLISLPPQHGSALILLQVQLNITAPPAAVSCAVQLSGGANGAAGSQGFFNGGGGQMMAVGVVPVGGAESFRAYGSVSPGGADVLGSGVLAVYLGGNYPA